MEQKPNRSEQLNELFGALAKAQAEMSVAELSNSNPFFKSRYADFTTIVKASRPSLTKNGLCVIQIILPNEGFGALHTVLGHSSGQFIESQVEIKPLKADVQSVGSYITYLKRYSYSAIVGITTGEDDDDGEAAMARGKSTAPEAPRQEVEVEYITREQYEMLSSDLEGQSKLKESILEGLKIDDLARIPKNRFNGVRKFIHDKVNELEALNK